MASAFNLTAQLNLRGPSNINQIASDIKKQLGTINGDVNLKINAQATKNVTQLNSALKILSTNLSQVNTNATSAASAISAFANAANLINKATTPTATNINKTVSAMSKLTQSQNTNAQSAKKATSEIEEFGKQSALAVRRFAAFSTATTVIFGFTNALRKGIGTFIEFEKEFVKVQQVTDKTGAELGGLEKEITRLSTSLGVSSSELIKVSSTLAQAGLNARDTQKAMQALALTDLAPSFDSLNDTVEGSIALMRQFNIGAGQLEKALGSINSVAAAFAVESSDLIAAIQRTGGVFASASKGVSDGTQALNEFLAVFTSVRQTTRESAETIATGLRTIFTRIQREDTIEALREYGISLTDLDGKFVGAYKAVELLSQGLGKLDPRDLRFSQIVEELGGFRQIGKVIPLIQQFTVAQQALGVAQRGQGSLAKDAITAQISLANQISKVREEFLALTRSIGSSDTFQALATGALSFASGLIKVADSVKGILPILAILGAGKAANAIGKFGVGFLSGIKKEGGSGDSGGSLANSKSPSPNTNYSLRDLNLLDDILRSNTDAITKLSNNLSTATSALSSMSGLTSALQSNATNVASNTSSLNILTQAIQNMKPPIGPNSGGLIGSNGSITHKFARGGVVPGSGNRDTVPAMLMPGEFVIRKKAVETIGADNLHAMNKYGGGGSIRAGSAKKRQKFAGGSKVKRGIIDNQFTEATDIVDGDTIGGNVYTNMTFRFAGIDAPEANQNQPYADTATNSLRRRGYDILTQSITSTSGGKNRGIFKNDAIATDMIRKGYAVPGSSESGETLYGNKFVPEAEKAKKKKVGLWSIPNHPKALLYNKNYQQKSFGGKIQKFMDGGKVTRNLGYIDFDVINDPANAEIVEKAMKEAGVDGPRKYADYLTDLAIKARKDTTIKKLTALYGVAGAGKSSIAMGRGANDAGRLRETNRFPILTPEDISKASEVMLLTSTVSKDKLDGALKEADKIYVLSTTTQEEKDRILKQRMMRDVGGVGLFGRKAGATTGAQTDSAKEEALLTDRFGSKAMILGRDSSGRLRRKRGNELVEATKKKLALTWGGFSPTTAGHESLMDAAKAAGIPYEDFIALVGANEAVDPENYRTAVFDQDFRLALAKAGFGSKGATVLPKAFGDMSVPLAFDMGEKGGRRQITLADEGSMVFVADKKEQQLEKYKKAGYGVANLERTGGISGTAVRKLLLDGNLEELQKVVSPGVFSLLKDNLSQLQNRSNILPSLIKQAQDIYQQQVVSIDEQLAAIGITRADNKKAAIDPEYAAQLEIYQSLKEKKKKLATKASFEPYRLLSQLAEAEPDKYALKLDRAGGPSTTSGLQEAILKKVAKETAVKKSSGILPAQGSEILKRFGADRLPTDASFGPFSGKTVRDTAEGGKLKYWNSAFRPETKADKLAYYTATRDYLIDKFNESQGTQKATALAETTNAVLSSKQLGLVGLNPLGYTGLLGPETWNLGVDPSGQERSIDASIVQRGLPTQYQNVIDYLSGRTEEIVGGASKLLGITPKKLTQKQRETLGQGNIEGALLEQIFGSADATILDDALRTRPIDFPMGIGPKAAKIFGIDPDIPTEVKRTIDSNSRGKAVEEFQKYFRQQYGIPDPEKVTAFADGGEVYSPQQLVSLAKYRTGPFPGGGTDSEFINRYLEDNDSFMEYLKGFHADPQQAYDATKNAAKDLLEMFNSKESMSGSKRSGKLYSTVAGGKLKTILTQIGNPLSSNKDIPSAIGKNFNLNGSLLSTSESPDTAAVFQPENGSSAMLSIFRNKNIPSIDVDKAIFDTSTEDDVIKALSKYIDPVSGKSGADFLSRSRSATRIEKEFILPPTSKFRIDDIDRIFTKDQEDKLLGGNIRTIEGMKVLQLATGGKVDESNFETIKKQILDKYPQINFRITKSKRSRGYNLLGGLKQEGDNVGNYAQFKQPSNLSQLQEMSDKMASSLMYEYGPNIDPSLLKKKQKFASGGEVKDLLTKYKAVLSSIMPPEYIGSDGFLQIPDGGSYAFDVESENKPGIITRLFRSIMPKYGQALGTGAPNLLKVLKDNKDKFSSSDYKDLTGIVNNYGKNTPKKITLPYGRESDLPHEAFHTIQSYLASYYPDIFNKLDEIAQQNKKEFTDIYLSSPLSRGLSSYDIDSMFPGEKSKNSTQYRYGMRSFISKNPEFEKIKDQTINQLSKNEVIPQLITMATKYKDKKAQNLLSSIFSQAGLRSDFASQNFFFGGKVDPLAKKYGLSKKEFDEQKKIAKFMGLDDGGFEEKLKLFSLQKQRLKGSKFEAIDASVSSNLSSKKLTEEQNALNEFLKTQKFAAGGSVKLYHGSNTGIDDNVLKSFKEKGALSDIATGYGQGSGFYLYTEKSKAQQQAKMRVNGGSNFTLASGDRSGKPMVLSFDEILDPKTFDLDYELQKGLIVQWLYDNYDSLQEKYAPLEDQTGLKGKLDKNPAAGLMSVGIRVQEGSQTLKSEDGTNFTVKGGSRKSIYAGSEGDVREGALIGQLMARIQAGDSALVNEFESKLFEKPLGLALKYVGSSPLQPINYEFFANGGSAQDTVPALLTPGEFVINKQAAQKIGYNKLAKLNQADKIQGYNKGGFVGVQKFALGGVPTNLSGDASSYFRTQAEYFGVTFNNYLKDLQKQIISKTLELQKDIPSSINRFRARSFELRGAIQAGSAAGASDEDKTKATDARDELTRMVKDITGSVDDTRINSAMNAFVNNLNNTAISFDEAHDYAFAMNDMFSEATDKGNQLQRVLGDLNEATGVAVQDLEKVASVADVLAADRLGKLRESADRYSRALALGAGSLVLFTGVVNKFLEAEKGRGSQIASAALGEGASAVGSAMALGSSVISNVSALAANAGGPGVLGTLGGAAAQLLPVLVNPVTAAVAAVGTAIFGVAAAMKGAANAARAFDKAVASENINQSLERITRSFDDFSKDIKNTEILKDIDRQLTIGISNAIANAKIDIQVPKVFWVNLIDSLSGAEGSADRSRILEKKGVSSYFESTTFGQSGILGQIGSMIGLMGLAPSLYSGAEKRAQEVRASYIGELAPDQARQQSEYFKGLSESLLKNFEQKLRTGTNFQDVLQELGTSTAPTAFAEAIARANPAIEEWIIRIQANTQLTDAQKDSQIKQIIASESYNKTLLNLTATVREIELDKLNKATRSYITSIERMLSNMDQALARTTNELDNLSRGTELANAALSGTAKAGSVSLKSINVLQNQRAYSTPERGIATAQAGEMFGPFGNTIQSLISVSNNLQDTVLSTINSVKDRDPSASPEKIAGAVRSALNVSLNDIGLPNDLSRKMAEQVQLAFSEIMAKGDKTVSFDQLVEKVEPLSNAVESARAAQEKAVKSLEYWQKNLNDYADAMNTMVDQQVEINSRLSKASDIEIKGLLELDKVFGKSISLNRTGQISRADTARLTGGATNAQDIQRNILRLEEIRASQQASADFAPNRGVGGTDEFKTMENRLRLTNTALRDNYTALKNMAESADLTSAALAKINEQQQKNQAGVSFIEKLVTSDGSELDDFGKALARLNVNMAGGTTNSTAEERSQTLQAFNMIAPLLGEQQNQLKATVLEAMLKESGIGVSGFSNQIINSLRNPEGDPAMQEAIRVYKDALEQQKQANLSLANIYEVMKSNTQEMANEKLITGFKNVLLTFEQQTLADIAKNVRKVADVLGGAQPAATKALGGVVYAESGKHIKMVPKGTDTVPAMLTPGEFVVNKQATQKNLPLLKDINSGTKYYAAGGIVSVDGIGVNKGKWTDPSYDAAKTFADRIGDKGKVTADTYPEILDLNAAKNFNSMEQVYRTPLSYYAVNNAPGIVGQPFSSAGNIKNSGPDASFSNGGLNAVPGVSYQSMTLRFSRSRMRPGPNGNPSSGFAPSGLSVNPNDPISDFQRSPILVGKVPKLDDLNKISPLLENNINIPETDVADYILAYRNLVNILSQTDNVQSVIKKMTDNETNMRNRASAYFRSNTSLTPDLANNSVSLNNLSVSYPDDFGFLYKNLNNYSTVRDLKNILGFSRPGLTSSSAQVVAGISSMENDYRTIVEKKTRDFESVRPLQDDIINQTTRGSKLRYDYQSGLDLLNKNGSKFIASEKSRLNKNLAARLEYLYEGLIFQAQFGKELFRDRSGDAGGGPTLPITLYNINKDKWKRAELNDAPEDQRGKLFSWYNDDFIQLQSDKPGSKPKLFPWTAGKFTLDTKKDQKDFDYAQVISAETKVYDDPSKNLNFPYNKVKAKYFNEELSRFDGPLQEYITVERTAPVFPGSPFMDMPTSLPLLWPDSIDDLAKFLEPGLDKPGYEYKFDGINSGQLKVDDAYLKSILDNDPIYNNLGNLKKFVVAQDNFGSKNLYGISFKSPEFDKIRLEGKDKLLGRKADKDVGRVVGSEDFTLGPNESFSEAKRVTFARALYDIVGDIKSAKPTNISGVQAISSELNNKLRVMSLDPNTDNRSPEYAKTDAIRAIFSSLFNPQGDIASYFGRLGFSLENDNFKNPVPPPKDPANPLRSKIDYYQNTNQDLTRNFKLLLQRETDYRRSYASQTQLGEDLAGSLRDVAEGFVETKVSADGTISKSKDKYDIKTYQDIEKIALNPYATPSKSQNRQKLFDELYAYYKNDVDSKGRPIWPKERSSFIGDRAPFGDLDLFTKDNLLNPKNIREWYAIQDNIINTSKTKDNISQQLDILKNNKNPDYISSNEINNSRNTAQKFNDYLTGNLYGQLPDAQFLQDWLLKTGVELEEAAKKASGGLIYASTGKYIDFKPKGTDTIPAMLTPGEFVVNKSATEKHLPLLQQMNKGGDVIYRASGSKEPEKSKKWWPAMFDFSSATKPAVVSYETKLVPVDIDGVSFPPASKADINRRIQRIPPGSWITGTAAEEYRAMLAEEQKLQSSSITINPPARRGSGSAKREQNRENKAYEIDLAKRMNNSLLNYDEETQMIAFATNAFKDDIKKPLIKSTPAFNPGQFRDLPLPQPKIVTPPVHAIALSSDNVKTTSKPSQNIDRLWYGGKLWDINNDGKAEELVQGNINSMWDESSPLINLTDKKLTKSGRLVLDKKYMTKSDLDFLKTWQESNATKSTPATPPVRVPDNKPSFTTEPQQPRSLPSPVPATPAAPSVRVPENKPNSTAKPPQPRSLPRSEPAIPAAPSAPPVRVPENKGAPLTRQEDALGKELIGYGPESFEPIDTDFGNQPKRTWSDYTNKYSLMGRLKSLTKDSSVNLNNDAQKFSVKYSRLSNADMKYIDSEKLRISRMSKDDKEWDELEGKRREAYGDDYVDRNYKFNNLNFRDWTDISGKYTTKAKLVSTFKDSATLQKENDKQVNLPISKLSRIDSDYVYRMIQGKRRDIKMDKFEAEYNASTGAPGWGYDDAGRPIRKEDYKAPDKIGGYQFDPVTGRVISGSGNFGPRPTRTFRMEDGRVTPISSPSKPLPKFASGIKSAEITDANRAAVISRARAALAKNRKRNEITKTSQYYAEKLGFDPSITEADLYAKLEAQQNTIQPINTEPPGLPGTGLLAKPNIGSPIVKPPVSTASPTVKPPVSAGKYPKTDGTRTDDLSEADQSIFTTQDLITQANETNRVYVLAAQIAQYRLAEQGINYKTGLPLKATQKPVTKQHGGLINYLANGGSVYDKRMNDPITQTLNRPRPKRPVYADNSLNSPMLTSGGNQTINANGTLVRKDKAPDPLGDLTMAGTALVRGAAATVNFVKDFPSGSSVKPIEVLFDVFDSLSDGMIGLTSFTGGVVGKSISNWSNLIGQATGSDTIKAFAETLNETSGNEINRGLERFISGSLRLGRAYDHATGSNLFEKALNNSEAKQKTLYEEKLALATANGVLWPVEGLNAVSAISSTIASGALVNGGFKSLSTSLEKEIALRASQTLEPRAGSQLLISALSKAKNTTDVMTKGIDKFSNVAGNPKDAIEGLNTLADHIRKGGYDEETTTGYKTGGVVYAASGKYINFKPQGTDTVPAMLTPGEFVINKEATSKHLPLLKEINSGTYSHGDIIKKFNRGGIVSPDYYASVGSINNKNNSNEFDFGNFMQKLMGQLSSTITQSIKEAYQTNNQQNVTQRSNGVSIDSKIFDSISQLTTRLQSVAETLSKINIPSTISLKGSHDVNVIINGDSVLNQLKPEMQDIVMKAVKDGFQKLINVNSPVPTDKLTNPFETQGPTSL
jgi:TP901 family phage tail tape measure protein